MKIGAILFLITIVTGFPIGILIDFIADKCDLPMQDGLTPVPWALLGLSWPATLVPFLVYCLLHKRKIKKSIPN